MTELFGQDLGIDAPSIAGSSIASTITWIAIVLVLALFAAIVIYMVIMNRKFGKKIVLFENISGQGYQPTIKDRARLIKIGDGGEEILFLRRLKLYRTAYGKKMGKNTYWFAVGQDGYWYNVSLGDLDAKMGMLDIEPIDRDMRYMHVAIRKNITERYRKIGFMEKYGSLMIGGLFLIIMLVGMWFLIEQIAGLVEAATGAMDKATASNDLIMQALSKVDEICSGGSGIR